MTKITLIPRISEKAYQLSQVDGLKTYVFEVPLTANKHTVARAVNAEYKVTVEDVRTVVVKGKTKQSYRKGNRPQTGKRSDIKKAYVTLKTGNTLPLFADEASADSDVKVKADKSDKEAK